MTPAHGWAVEVDTVGNHPPTLEAEPVPQVVQHDLRATGHHVGRAQGPAHPCADQRRLVEDAVVVCEGLAVRGHHEGGAGEMGEQDGVQAVGSEALHVEDARSEVAVGTPPGAGGGRKGQQETQDRSQRPRGQRA